MYHSLHLDLETFSEAPLKKTGLYRYAEDPSTEILCACYAFDAEEVKLWVPIAEWDLPREITDQLQAKMPGLWVAQDQCPEKLSDWILSRKEIRSHNFQFERTIINGHAGRRLRIPAISISQGVCTAAKAATYGLPRALGNAALALGTYPKSEDGKAGMMQLAKPCQVTKKRPLGRYTPFTDPEKFIHLYDYCGDDVRAERDLDDHIPDISPSEQRDWELDQKINDRGVRVDRESVENCQFLIEEHKANIEKEFIELTGVRPSQTGEVAAWVRAHGCDIENLQKDTVAFAVLDPNVPKNVKHVLVLRSIHASKAVAKYPAILKALMKDDRIRGMFLYYGAHSGRWSSMIVQLQNLFRGAINDPDTAIEMYRARSLDFIKAMYPEEPAKVFASTVRGMLIPSEGKDLISIDYAGIESRKIAWLYDEQWKLDAFRKQDNEGGPDNYMLAYANVFQIPPESVDKKQRQIGKPIDLGLGFEGGIGAFATMAKTYNVDLRELTDAAWGKLPERFMDLSKNDFEKGYIAFGDMPERTALICNAIKHSWRASHPKIKQGWKDTLVAAKFAVENPGATFQIPNGKLKFRMTGHWLQMRLPSGRKLNYFAPRIEKGEGVGDRYGSLTFMGINTDTRRWMRCNAYGGFLAQNGTQASSNDLLRNGMHTVDQFVHKELGYTYDLIGTIHDEAIMEVIEGQGSVEEVIELFCRLPPWAAGLPVTAEGWRAKRFKK